MLQLHKIEVLVDVRRWPTSKTKHFKQSRMQKWLEKAGIKYVWLGEFLGGYRSKGYENYMKSELFKTGIEKLLELAREKRCCLMCLEISPVGCHRRFISEHLKSLGIETLHIISKEKLRRTIMPQ